MNFVRELSKVIKATSKIEPTPVLTFQIGGWWFNGICYGDDEVAARKARDDYHNPDDLKDVL
jgi:hypothetical protein